MATAGATQKTIASAIIIERLLRDRRGASGSDVVTGLSLSMVHLWPARSRAAIGHTETDFERSSR